MTISIERLSADQYRPRADLTYVDVFNLHRLYETIAFTGNHILFGPKGLGKSLSVASYAAQKKCPIVTFDCSEDVRRAHLIGMFVVRGGETPFVLGALTSAIEVANEAGKCILVLEEINALSPQVQKILNSATDFRRRIEVGEAQKVFALREGAQLWIVGTMNPAIYGGAFSLNEDLKSRFRIIRLNYPNDAQERKIVRMVFDLDGASKEVRSAVDGILQLAFETRQGTFEYPLSTRDVVQIVEDMFAFEKAKGLLGALTQALTFVSGKFDGDDLVTFKKRVSSVFRGVELDGEEKVPTNSRLV